MKTQRTEEERQYSLYLKAKKKTGDKDIKEQKIAFIILLQQENRRKELEAAWETSLNEMQEKWKTKERMIEKRKQ
ncbi:unnamed protein product, partial [Rotaria sp. Silwood2]